MLTDNLIISVWHLDADSWEVSIPLSCFSRFMTNKGHKTGCAMTRRDFGWLCNFTPQATLREIAQPYRFWGLLGSCLAADV